MVVFLVVLAPIFSMGIYIRNWGANTVRNELIKSSTVQIEFYLKQLEQEIERLKILQYTCLTDENLNRLAVQYDIMSPYNIVSNTKQLQARLTTIQYSSNYVKNVSAHIFSINKTISSTEGTGILDQRVYERINAANGLRGAQIIRYQGGLYLITIYPLNHTNQNNNNVIEIELNQETLQADIEQFDIYPDCGSFLLDLTNSKEVAQSYIGRQLSWKNILEDIENTNENGAGVGIEDEYRYYFVYDKSEYLDLLLLRYLPEKLVFTPLKNFDNWVIIFIIVSIVVIIIFTLSINTFINKPIKKLVEVFRQVEKGNFQVNLDTDEVKSTEFAYLYARFSKMAERLNMLIDQVYKQKILMQRAELKQLQAQIKPHFLYNSFFIINTMAQMGDENLVDFTNQLGEYYRYLTRNVTDIIPLYEEVTHARTYINIQSIRFSKNLTIDFEECPEKFLEYQVPRLILQPIIENAFEYAVEKRVKDRKIKVSFVVHKDRLHICVEDNGVGMSDEKRLELQSKLYDQSEHIEVTALINIHRRLKLQYGEMSGIILKESPLGGLCVELILG